MSRAEVEVQRHRLTVDEYCRMADVGILRAGARVELIEGEIIDMPPMGSRHAYVVSELGQRLVEQIGRQAQVRCQLPVRLGEYSEPEPDFAVVQARGTQYAARHPVAEDVLLVIEVSDSTAAYDHRVKVPLYARHGICELWIFDLSQGKLRICRSPRGEEYVKVVEADLASPQRLLALPSVAIDVGNLLSSG